MKRVWGLLLLMTLACVSARAQGKGVDQQNDRIRDQSTDRAPGQNGTKQNNGTGRGFDFGKGRTPVVPAVPNPYRFSARRDAVLRAVEELMREQKLVIDTAVSKPEDGIVISQPFRFVKGAVVAVTELNRYAEVPQDTVRGWTQGRYTMVVEVRAIDGTTTNVSVNTRVEGRTDGAAGAEWVSLRSNGTAEQDFIKALVEKVTGGTP